MSEAAKPIASLSLDLDNLWTYMRTHGDPGWEALPSYLDLVVPRVLRIMDELDLTITFFVVGQDAAQAKNRSVFQELAASPHEIANHSFRHEQWFHRYTPEEIDAELTQAEEAIAAATGRRTQGFRGPGFSLSRETLDVLAARGYAYDATTFPTFIGPLARAYYFMTAKLSDSERQERELLFGSAREALRPLAPYVWRLANGRQLVELPVTTMPLARVPIHLSYLLYLAGFSERLARVYFASALKLCRLRGVEPSLLLHPLDFLGGDDTRALDFFPAMNQPGARKVRRVRSYLQRLAAEYHVVPTGEHARLLLERGELPAREPVFDHDTIGAASLQAAR